MIGMSSHQTSRISAFYQRVRRMGGTGRDLRTRPQAPGSHQEVLTSRQKSRERKKKKKKKEKKKKKKPLPVLELAHERTGSSSRA